MDEDGALEGMERWGMRWGGDEPVAPAKGPFENC